MKNKNLYFAEIVQSSLNNWIVQSWQWNNVPSFGSMVAIDTIDKTLFGAIYQVETGSSDPARTPFAYQKTEEELLADYPQIYEFLKTQFFCLPLGFKQQNQFLQLTPPEPAKIHSFVRFMTENEKIAFFHSSNFLSLIFNCPALTDIDELLIALLRDLKKDNLLNEASAEEFIESFSLISGNDYRRLKLFLRRANLFLQ